LSDLARKTIMIQEEKKRIKVPSVVMHTNDEKRDRRGFKLVAQLKKRGELEVLRPITCPIRGKKTDFQGGLGLPRRSKEGSAKKSLYGRTQTPVEPGR